MNQSIISAPHFHNEEAAYAFVEARIWPHGRLAFAGTGWKACATGLLATRQERRWGRPACPSPPPTFLP